MTISTTVNRRLRQFVKDARAGATALVAVAITVMTLGGGVLIIDHMTLVDQRDTLKAAVDAAGIAATRELGRLLGTQSGITDEEIETALLPIARRYVEFNLNHLPETRLSRAKATLAVELAINRAMRTVDVSATSDLGGALLSNAIPMMTGAIPSADTRAKAEIENVINPVEIVLAIDMSKSMDKTLKGKVCNPVVDCDEEIWGKELCDIFFAASCERKIDIVKEAASGLVEVIQPSEDDRVAIGVVPWHAFIRLDTSMTSTWKTNGWAVYPTTRYYSIPYWCQPDACSSTPSGITQTLAAAAPEWNGCLDLDRTGSVNTEAELPNIDDVFDTPFGRPFAHAIFPSFNGAAYECMSKPFQHKEATGQYCYSGTRYHREGETYTEKVLLDPENFCDGDNPPILPLSSDAEAVKAAIDGLSPTGNLTYSALGLMWSQNLLDNSWNATWGGGTHPMPLSGASGAVTPSIEGATMAPADGIGTRGGASGGGGNVGSGLTTPTPASRNPGVRKVIVLLTDGVDTFCDLAGGLCENKLGFDRSDACTAVKKEGTEIFVVTAMHPDVIPKSLEKSLLECSSEGDKAEGQYVFFSNETSDDLNSAFSDIANQLRTVRRLN